MSSPRIGFWGDSLGCTLFIVPIQHIDQWILRHGGTDPDWLIFPNDPPGLVKLREEAALALADPESAAKG